jgi:hypothetical protein
MFAWHLTGYSVDSNLFPTQGQFDSLCFRDLGDVIGLDLVGLDGPPIDLYLNSSRQAHILN